MTSPPPNAFTRASTFSKVIDTFKKATGLSVKDGKLMKLHDGSHVISFNDNNAQHPFYATGGPSSLRLNAGFVSYAGKTYFYPAATYSGLSPGGVFLRIRTNYDPFVYVDGSSNEFWYSPPVSSRPELVWAQEGALGAYCQITRDIDGVPTAGSPQTLYIPVAAYSGGSVINFITRNICIEHGENGDIDYRFGWG